MTNWGKIALFAAGLIGGGLFEWQFLHQPSVGAAHAEPWALPNFEYNEVKFQGDESIFITGSLTGNDIGYPVNTWHIYCHNTEKNCQVADVEEIGRRQLGEINIADWPVLSWTPTTIVAQAAEVPGTCARNTITINRQQKTVRYMSEPINSASQFCTKGRKLLGPPSVEDWRIGNPKQPWGGYL